MSPIGASSIQGFSDSDFSATYASPTPDAKRPPPKKPVVKPAPTNVFAKQAVIPSPRKVPPKSSLTRLLNGRKSSAAMRELTSRPNVATMSANLSNTHNKVLKMRVVFPENNKISTMPLEIVGPMTLEEVIKLILVKHDQRNQHKLKSGITTHYELRITEKEDGEDDDVDMDLPPLRPRDRDIHAFNVRSVALCLNSKIVMSSSADSDPPIRQRGITLKYNDPAAQTYQYLRVSIPSPGGLEKLTVQLKKRPRAGSKSSDSSRTPVASMHSDVKNVGDLFRELNKKKQNNTFVPDYFYFAYSYNKDYPLSLKLPVEKLQSDQIWMLPKISGYASEREYQSALRHPHIQLGQYKEYNVSKVKGKDKRLVRVLGVDKYKITKRVPKEHQSTLSSMFGSSEKVPIEIKSVTNCRRLQESAKGFAVCWLGSDRKPREHLYECESEAQCTEIVSKINFMRNLHNSSIESWRMMSGAASRRSV